MPPKLARLRKWQWHDDLYDVPIVLLHGPWPASERWLARTFLGFDGEWGQGHGGKAIWIETERGSVLVLWFPDRIDLKDVRHLGLIAHEALHAASFVLRDRGIVMGEEAEEAFAYYVSWIVEHVAARIARKAR